MPAKPQRDLDWEAVWKSLNWDDDTRLRHAESERLRQRAQQYAAPPPDSKPLNEDASAYLTFDLGAERYGLDVMCVRGVRDNLRIVPVPGVPSFYKGIINVRGQIITVLDLRLFFGQDTDDDVNTPDEVVLAQASGLSLALLAHQIIGITRLSPSEIIAVEHLPFAQGISKAREIILNIEQLFENERLILGAGLSE
ncbi:MAG: purine-binding chemotaxis protein CheW [Anaerolineae bacterium]|nr:purine-binding chemotaxis protein CheW [Anaerolineae bacterium]